MKKFKFFLILILFSGILLVCPYLVYGQGGTEDPCQSNDLICLENPLKYDNVNDIINAIASLLATIAIPLSILIIIWGGIQIMTAGGSEERLKQGKKAIMWAVIGFAIVTLARFLVGLVTEILAK